MSEVLKHKCFTSRAKTAWTPAIRMVQFPASDTLVYAFFSLGYLEQGA